MLRTRGRSMLPLVREGDVLLFEPAGAAAVRVGELAVIRGAGRLLAHRVIDLRGEGPDVRLREKGDNEPRARWVDAGAVEGRALAVAIGDGWRNLAADTSSRRIRWLTALARREADAAEAFTRLFGPCRDRAWPWRAARMLAAVPAVLRRAVLRVFLSAHGFEGEEAARASVSVAQTVLQTAAGPRPGGRAERVAAGLRWQEAALLERHGLLPASVLLDAGSEEARAALRDAAVAAALWHERALGEAVHVSRSLTGAGVSHAVWKGPALYERLYRDRFPRPYDDLDVLVRPRDADRAVRVLAALGYAPVPRGAAAAFTKLFHFHLPLRPAEPGLPTLELHWCPVDRANLYRIGPDEVDGLLGRAVHVATARGAFATLRPDDAWLCLLLHVAKHALGLRAALRRGEGAAWFCGPGSGVRWLWVLDAVLASQAVPDRGGAEGDWAALGARVRAWNVARPVAEVLSLAERLAPGAGAGAALARLGLDAVAAVRPPPAARRRARHGLRMSRLGFRPARLSSLAAVFAPGPEALAGFYRVRSRALLPLLYAVHPVVAAVRLLVPPRFPGCGRGVAGRAPAASQ